MALREARLGTRAVTILVATGVRVSQRRGTMIENASRARRFTLLFLSVSRGQNKSNT